MPWNNSTKRMTYPVGNGDISQATGVAGPPDTMGNMVANSTLLNKWAKYKPVKKQGLDFPNQRNSDFTWKTVAQIEALSEVPWWLGYNGQCGLTFTYYENIGSPTTGFIKDLLTTDPEWTLAWGYERPTGGTYPYRNFDFLQYDGLARKPVTGVFNNLQLASNNTLIVQLNTTRSGDGLLLSDLVINSLKTDDWYVGIVIYKSSTIWTYAFSTTTIGNGADRVQFTGMSNFVGNVKIVPFISSVRWNPTDPVVAGTFVSCDVAPEDVVIRAYTDPYVTSIDTAQWTSSQLRVVNMVAVLKNNSSSATTATTIHVKVYESGITEAVGSWDKSDVAVPANDQLTVSTPPAGISLNRPYDSSKTYTLVLTSDSNVWSGSKMVDEPRN